MVKNLSTRQLKLLFFLKQQKSHLPSSEIAKHLNVSTKTIRNDIKMITNTIPMRKLEIQSSPSKGFLLRVYDAEYMEQLKRDESSIPSTPLERSYHIIQQLLTTDQYIRINDLAEALYIDRTAISRSLKYVRQCLEIYSLTLNHRPNYGLKVEGEEFYFRLCIAEYVYHKQFIANPIESDFSNEVYTCLSEMGISIPDGAFLHLMIHITIMIDRIKNGYPICFVFPLHKPEPCYEYLIGKDIASIIKKYYHIEMSEDELAYLAIHLFGKRTNSISAIESCINNSLIPTLNRQIELLFDRIQCLFGLSFHQDNYLKKALGIHFHQMFNRLGHTTFLRNSMLKDVKTQYPLAYAISMEAWFSAVGNVVFTKVDHEVAFIAIHFQYALERGKRNTTKKSVLLVNDNRASTTELLSFTLLKKFHSSIEIRKKINPKELNLNSFDNYDLVLTTVPIKQKMPIPFYHISAIPTESQLDDLKTLVFNQSLPQITDYIADSNIHLHVEVDNQAQCLGYIYQKMMGHEDLLTSQEEFISHEKVGANELHFGIALPKLFIATGETKLHCFVLKKPIIWHETMVKLILVMTLKKQDTDEILNVYQALLRCLRDDKAVNALLRAHTKQDLLSLEAAVV